VPKLLMAEVLEPLLVALLTKKKMLHCAMSLAQMGIMELAQFAGDHAQVATNHAEPFAFRMEVVLEPFLNSEKMVLKELPKSLKVLLQKIQHQLLKAVSILSRK